MEAGFIVREVLEDGLEPKARVALFREKLAADAGAQEELVGALLRDLARNPAGGMQCLAACMGAAQAALRAQLRRGEPLALALRGAGASHAAGVADLAAMVLKTSDAPEVSAAAATGLWFGLAKAEDVATWASLAPSDSRSAAIRLWSRRPALGPPSATAAQVASWLVEAGGSNTEKQFLLSATHRIWNANEAAISSRVEDVLVCLLNRMEVTADPSVDWLASVVAKPISHSAQVCALLEDIIKPTAMAASQLLAAPGGRAALVFAWVSLYGALLTADFGGDSASISIACCNANLGLLGDIFALLASNCCWLEVVAAQLCIVLKWPPGDWLASGGVHGAVAWVDFARRTLLEIPDMHPESPVARALPLILASVPRAADERTAVSTLVCELHSRSRPFTAAPSVGLLNLGNTCYLNSFLQALGLSEGLVSRLFVLFEQSNPDLAPSAASARGKLQVQKAVAQVLTRLAVSRHSFGPRALANLTPFGLSGRQQDATELARWLLGQLGDAEVHGSLIEQSFGGQLRTIVRCISCGHTQLKLEAFADICLPVQHCVQEEPMPTVESDSGKIGNEVPKSNADCGDLHQNRELDITKLLQLYLGEESLSGYRCDSCGTSGSSKRRCEVARPPELLMLALSRFAFTASGGQQKIDTHISVDKVLHLPFSQAEPVADAIGVSDASHATYSLYAIITHIGSSPHSGHYVCLGRESDHATALWHCYDDSNVRPLPEMSQEDLNRRVNGSSTAYVLFYRRDFQNVGGVLSEPASRRSRWPPRFFAEAVLSEVGQRSEDSPNASSSSRAAFPPPPPRGGGDAAHISGPHGGGFGGGLGGGGGWVC